MMAGGLYDAVLGLLRCATSFRHLGSVTRWLMAANIEVMHQFRDPLQCHLAQAKARQQRFKGDLVSYMGEGRSIEIKTQRVIRAISWRA